MKNIYLMAALASFLWCGPMQASGQTDEAPLLSTDFSQSDALQHWNIADENADGVTWFLQNGVQGVTYNADVALGGADDWLITPQLNTTDGQDYLVEFTLKQSAAFGPDLLEVCYGHSQQVAEMTQSLALLSVELDGGLGRQSYVYRFTGNHTGTTSLGFHIATAEQNGSLTLEWLKIAPVEKAQPSGVENLIVTSDYQQKSVTFAWTNPTLDTSRAPIQSSMVARIYQDDLLIGQLYDTKAGETVNHTLNPEKFGGLTTFKVTVSLGDRESAPAVQEINLDDVQGEGELVKSFRGVNKSNSADWVVEDNEGKFKWAFDYGSVFSFIYSGSQDTHEDDWLISPSVTLEKGKRYMLKYELKTSRDYAATIDVCLAPEPNSAAMNQTPSSHPALKQNGFGEFASQQFEVEADGDYHIGFHAYEVATTISMRNLEVYCMSEATGVAAQQAAAGIRFDRATSTLQLPDASSRVCVYNLQGQLVLSQTVEGQALNLSVLEEGLYLAVIYGAESGHTTLKFMK